ncbi:hypothetical protein BP5796_10058 [Coleophoma crateriformis]|uniref:NCT transcriptional regulatory complex subunit A n=1 Tax=Coleophoma crateriformis TaxID=565419 RepID=A0A3D8QU43_9HELO|nr:hypothetical protein BP5796_10058 [Coleophoma crateriformis]
MESNWRPQSPDLSGFLPSPTKNSHSHLHYQSLPPQQSQSPSQYQPQPQVAPSSSYAPRSPVLTSFNNAPDQYQPSSSFTNHKTYENQNTSAGQDLGDFGDRGYMPPIPALPPIHSFGAQQNEAPYYPEQAFVKTEGNNQYQVDAQQYISSPTMASKTARGRPPKTMAAQPSMLGDPSFQPAPDRKNPNPENIEIKTKFPVARIKRIMQADEEVGKVAQVTPVAVNKALELFMIQLVTGAAAIAREKGGKRVTAQHLKQVVESDQQFDFLQEIVGKVGEGQEGAGGETKKRKGDSDSEEEVKPKKGRGRKKKSSDDQ